MAEIEIDVLVNAPCSRCHRTIRYLFEYSGYAFCSQDCVDEVRFIIALTGAQIGDVLTPPLTTYVDGELTPFGPWLVAAPARGGEERS